MGIEVSVEGLGKSFGKQSIWEDVSLTLPAGEVSALLGPSGTGKSVFLKVLLGLIRPDEGHIYVGGVDLTTCAPRHLYDIRRYFGVLFQDGALFGSMSLYDNVAFPLREHTNKTETEIRSIVMEKLEINGLADAWDKLPGQISGGMRKRAGLARALVLEPEIILCDEPESGLDPVRTANLSQTIIDINAQTDATVLIVTHNIGIARSVPDNLGMLYARKLVEFGPRELLLTSDKPAVRQFLAGSRFGPIGMSEEKDATDFTARITDDPNMIRDLDVPVEPQMEPSPGLPPRQGALRRRERMQRLLQGNGISPAARDAIENCLRTGQQPSLSR
ncbi:ABC transporter ATP-binding protein [Corynebacterium hansenii]|uniref:ABC transporter ATP-binding protein n=1 Tax=Corynebacterium hansenii TaxID=394964 RepID=A0ABV7ZQZ9_9CORY|nr:ATP-binding cassette domain-containing protein [Corynebacterium hansenii]WJZ00423.1 putative phospholipid import ATP-binding protein MlaF [Corynebacterium hansenii]